MFRFILFLIISLGIASAWGESIGPADVVVVANTSDPDSMEIAQYYMAKRDIPEENLITLSLPVVNDMGGGQFITELFNPLREKLVDAGWIDAVMGRGYDAAGRREFVPLGHEIGFLVLCRLPFRVSDYPDAIADAFPFEGPQQLGNAQAAVDSELSLLMGKNMPIRGALNNPLFKQSSPNGIQRAAVIRVARLDGPSVADVKQLIDSAQTGENEGLKGRAYLDLGGPHKQGEMWLESTANLATAEDFPLSIDREKALFGWKDRLDGAALYFGWWTHAPKGGFESPRYRFPPGAIAIHISSFSGTNLRQGSNRWGPELVKRGVAATVANVYEPYLGLTHHPQLFLEAMIDGKTAGEAAYYSLPGLSWMTLFLGDPLYRPFQVTLDEQLNQLDPADPYAQYVILREGERRRQADGDEAAFKYLTENFHRGPGLALAYAIAQGHEARNERDAAIKQLRFADAVIVFPPEDAGLAYEIADFLIQLGEREMAYSILKKLADARYNENADVAFMPEAILIARQLGERDQANLWQATVDQIKEKRRLAAERRRERAEQRKAQQQK